MNKKSVFLTATAFLLAWTFCGASAQEPKSNGGYSAIDVASPEWVGKLAAAKDAEQMLVVAAFNPDATGAWISLHEKQKDGSWRMTAAGIWS